MLFSELVHEDDTRENVAHTQVNCLDQNPPVHYSSAWVSAGEAVRKLVSLGSQLLLLHVRVCVCVLCCCGCIIL